MPEPKEAIATEAKPNSGTPPEGTPPANPTPEPQTPPMSPDVAALLEKARKEEKDKVYPTLEKNKADLRLAREAHEQSEAAREDLEKQVAEFQKNAPKGTNDKLADMQRNLDTMQNKIITEQKEREIERLEMAKEIRHQNLTNYRERRLREAGPDIIAEMVSNNLNSETDIDAAIIQAKTKHTEIQQRVRAQIKQEGVQAPVPGPTGTPPNSGQPGGESGEFGGLTEQEIRDMTPEEWSKARGRIRGQVDAGMKNFYAGRQ